MSKIRNTTEDMRDPAARLGFLAESLLTGSADTFITGQERAGQHELVHSDSLPAKCSKAAFEALGFTFGDPDPADPLFMPATLPEGWVKQATDHSMGSVILDPLGRERVAVFYKAAFYDRSAHMTLIGLGWYVQKWVEYDGPAVIFDEQWATREAVLAEMERARDQHLREAAEFRGFASGDDGRRDAENRSGCAGIADKREASAAMYDAAIKALSGDA